MQKNQKKDDNLDKNLSKIKNTYLVLSGKGGVGKSTVAVNLALSLADTGKKVGLLDIDIHGPSVPMMLGLEGKRPMATAEQEIIPIDYKDEIKVMSIGFLLDKREDAVIWRGPLKHGVIRQFLSEVQWGELDYLIVDSPPGTGDEPLSIAQLIKKRSSAILVTTPQKVSVEDVRKSITFCRQLNLPVVGVIENMSGFVCPNCGTETRIFKSGGGEEMAKEMKTKFLGSIPIEPRLVDSTDEGEPYLVKTKDSATAKAFAKIVKSILKTKK